MVPHIRCLQLLALTGYVFLRFSDRVREDFHQDPLEIEDGVMTVNSIQRAALLYAE
jgi:hypothetical protein